MFTNKKGRVKRPVSVVDKWTGGSLTRRPKGPFAVVRSSQLNLVNNNVTKITLAKKVSFVSSHKSWVSFENYRYQTYLQVSRANKGWSYFLSRANAELHVVFRLKFRATLQKRTEQLLHQRDHQIWRNSPGARFFQQCESRFSAKFYYCLKRITQR